MADASYTIEAAANTIRYWLASEMPAAEYTDVERRDAAISYSLYRKRRSSEKGLFLSGDIGRAYSYLREAYERLQVVCDSKPNKARCYQREVEAQKTRVPFDRAVIQKAFDRADGFYFQALFSK